MSYAHINGAQLYYETYGVDPPDRPRVPLLLIHGAMSTGQTDWREVAPLLARKHRVIVPDCRGHGRSTNPERTYTFREIADDLAELIRRLGYARAHIVGHSNGGNVALVLLLEYSEVVQTCTLQAANAFVSHDLLVNQDGWDPEWLTAERPGWARELQGRHAPIHGRDYWRQLLVLTQVETLSYPNYTGADLVLAARPTLVIQGQLDRVNVPGAHGQFLARNIPEAEAWFPDGVGHDVQRVIPEAWVQHLLGFLDRRGDDANAAIDHLRRQMYSGGRETVFAVRAEYVRFEGWIAEQTLGMPAHLENEASGSCPVAPIVSETMVPELVMADLPNRSASTATARSPMDNPARDGQMAAGPAGFRTEELRVAASEQAAEEDISATGWVIRVAGQVLVPEQRRAALDAVSDLRQMAGMAVAVHVEDQVSVLLTESTPWALAACPLADIRSAPDVTAERVSQMLAGEAARMLEERDGWAHILLPSDGCLGWLPDSLMLPCTDGEAAVFAASAEMVTVAGIAEAYLKPSRNAGRAGKLPFGISLPVTGRAGRWAGLRLPDGITWWVPDEDLLPVSARPRPDAAGVAQALKLFQRWIGVPYLAGGRTFYGIDAAGLAHTFLRFLSVTAPRQIALQFASGRPVEGSPRAGDLIFFAHETATAGNGMLPVRSISHVAISLGGYRLLQAGGGALCVNTMKIGRPRTPAARWLRTHIAGVRRFTED
jgi:pimeloyl-ACP methyl ester carboxylesterase